MAQTDADGASSAQDGAESGAAARRNPVEESLLIGGESGAAMPSVEVSGGGASTFALIVRVVLALALVAAAIYALAFFLRKFYRKGARQDPFVKVIGSAPLGANKAAHVIAVGSRAWLVGAGEHSVSLIAEITDQETVDAMLLEESRRGAGDALKTGFAGLFARAVSENAQADTGVVHAGGEGAGESAASEANEPSEERLPPAEHLPSAERLRKTRERFKDFNEF